MVEGRYDMKWKGVFTLAFAFIAILLFSNMIFAAAPTNVSAYAQRISDILQQSSVAYIAVGIAILISALLYMGHSILSDARMLAMSKDTFYQAIVSLVLIASLPALYTVVSTIVITLFFGDMNLQGNDMFSISKLYIAWTQIYFFIHLVALTMLNMMISNLINQTYNIPLGNKLVPIDLVSVAKPIMYAVGFGVNLLTTALFINGFQLMLLNLIESSIIPIFLPLGVILRAFPTTMNAGNILIAICIGAYIITPAVFLFDIYLITTLLDPNSPNQTSEKLGLMKFFYNQTTLEAVMDSSKCPLLRDMMDKVLNKDYSIFEKPIDSAELKGQCNVDVGVDSIKNMFKGMPGWAQAAIGATAVSKVVNGIFTSVSLVSKFLNKGGKVGKISGGVALVSSISSNVSSVLFALFLMLYIMDVIESVGISFIILAAILPFLNFTIIVLFMREFSQTVLGTPLNLGHLVRLI